MPFIEANVSDKSLGWVFEMTISASPGQVPCLRFGDEVEARLNKPVLAAVGSQPFPNFVAMGFRFIWILYKPAGASPRPGWEPEFGSGRKSCGLGCAYFFFGQFELQRFLTSHHQILVSG